MLQATLKQLPKMSLSCKNGWVKMSLSDPMVRIARKCSTVISIHFEHQAKFQTKDSRTNAL